MPTGDGNKFSPLESSHALYSIPTRSAALQAVNQSHSNIIKASETIQNYGHYLLPDPGLFIHPTTVAKYYMLWPWVCDSWLIHVKNKPSIVMSNQLGCTFLSIDNGVPGKAETKSAHHWQDYLDIILPYTHIYPRVERQSNLIGQLFGRIGSTL